jgi:hypothetical protein
MRTGCITVMGVAQRDVEVLGVAGTKVRQVARTDGDGQFRFDDAIDRVVARFAEPFLGVVHRPAPDGAPIDIDVARDAIVRLTITIAPPAGVVFDWVDVKLTPRLDDLPPVVVLAAGVESGLHEALWLRRITEPRTTLRVLRGAWDLRAQRWVDGPLLAPRNNQTAAQVTLATGVLAAEQLGGFSIPVGDDTTVTLQLRTLRPEEQ